jgi:hypothetical protein
MENLHITFQCAEGIKTGVIVRAMKPGKYIVRDCRPVSGQPATRFVFEVQIITPKKVGQGNVQL